MDLFFSNTGNSDMPIPTPEETARKAFLSKSAYDKFGILYDECYALEYKYDLIADLIDTPDIEISDDNVLNITDKIVRTSDIAAILKSDVINDLTIECGNNSTIIFNGPLLKRCTISGNNTTLRFVAIMHTFDECELTGTFSCEWLYPELFGAVGDGEHDDTSAIQECLNVAATTHIFNVKLLPHTYRTTDTLYYRGGIKIKGTLNWNNYHESQCSRILVDFDNEILTDENGNKYPKELKFALDSDCYIGASKPDSGKYPPYICTGERFPAATLITVSRDIYASQSGDTTTEIPYYVVNRSYEMQQNYSPSYSGPIHIQDVFIQSVFDLANNKFMFGAIRAIGMTQGLISGVDVKGFLCGMILCKGWNFIIERTNITVGCWGIILGGEITMGSINSLQITRSSSYNITDVTKHKSFAMPVPFTYDTGVIDEETGKEDLKQVRKTSNTLLQFVDAFFNMLSAPEFYSVCCDSRESYTNSENRKKWRYSFNKMPTVGMGAFAAGANLDACCLEGWDVGCAGYNVKLTFNTPYIEGIKKTAFILDSNYIIINNALGTIGNTSGYTYAVVYDRGYMMLNNAQHGTFYPSYKYGSSTLNGVDDSVAYSYNENTYNHVSYVINNYKWRGTLQKYVNISQLKFDIGDTIFVRNQKNDEDLSVNWGNYFMMPITLEMALERMRNDDNYANVKRIILCDNTILNDSLTWFSKTGKIEIGTTYNHSYSLTINAKQYFESDVEFNSVNSTITLNLNTSLCSTVNSKNQFIKIRNRVKILYHSNDAYIIDNTGELPNKSMLSKNVALHLTEMSETYGPNLNLLYRNNYSDLCNIVAEYNYNTIQGGTYENKPSIMLSEGYIFKENDITYIAHKQNNKYTWTEMTE